MTTEMSRILIPDANRTVEEGPEELPAGDELHGWIALEDIPSIELLPNAVELGVRLEGELGSGSAHS